MEGLAVLYLVPEFTLPRGLEPKHGSDVFCIFHCTALLTESKPNYYCPNDLYFISKRVPTTLCPDKK